MFALQSSNHVQEKKILFLLVSLDQDYTLSMASFYKAHTSFTVSCCTLLHFSTRLALLTVLRIQQKRLIKKHANTQQSAMQNMHVCILI